MIPPCSALNLIQKYDDISKPYCTIGLIELTDAIACNIRYIQFSTYMSLLVNVNSEEGTMRVLKKC